MSDGLYPQDGDDSGDFDTWLARRNADLAVRPEADAAARDLWNQGTQGGIDLQAPNPSDLTAIGLAALTGRTSYPGPTSDEIGDGGGVHITSAAGLPYGDSGAAGGQGEPDSPMDGRPRQGSSLPVEDPGRGVTSPNAASDPTVSEVDVVGRRPAESPDPHFLDSLNHNPVVRGAAGFAGYAIGLPAGFLRGGWHALEGVWHDLNFAALGSKHT
jgi:hypothetical protein